MIIKRQREFSKKITKLVNNAIREGRGYVCPGQAERISFRRVLAKDKGTGKEFEKLIDAGTRSASGTSVEALMERINRKSGRLVPKSTVRKAKRNPLNSEKFKKDIQYMHDHNLDIEGTAKFSRGSITRLRNL